MFDFLKQVKIKVFNVNTDSPNSYGSRQAKPRIVGGEKAKLGQFPFQVIFYHGPIEYNIINLSMLINIFTPGARSLMSRSSDCHRCDGSWYQ